MIARKVAVVITALGILTAKDAAATPRWVDRLLTLPGPVAGTIDIGGAFAHAEYPIGPPCGTCSWNGTGVSVEGVLGIASRVDIGLRVGIRGFDDNRGINEGAATNADTYGRFYDQLTFYGQAPNAVYGDYAFTNPELRVRVRILHLKHIFELGVEARTIFPVVTYNGVGTDATLVVGAPMALHLGKIVRFDFGAYTHLVFIPGNLVATLDLPAAFWFQVTNRVFLGPMFGFRFYNQNVYGGTWRNADFNLGFGLGVSLARRVDFKFQVYFPRVEDGAQFVGAGAGVGFYFD
jgi:hypothetical protein